MALPTSLKLAFVTPERAIVHEQVDEVELPGEDGYFGVLPGHAPLLAALRTGEMWYRRGTERKYAFIAGGFAEVLPDTVSILAMVAERAEDIDEARAEAAKRWAEERLSQAGTISDHEIELARITMLRALTRLNVTRQTRQRH